MIKKLLLMTIVLLCFFSVADAGKVALKPFSSFDGGKRYRLDKIDVLELHGDYREMGRQYGKLMKEELNNFYLKRFFK